MTIDIGRMFSSQGYGFPPAHFGEPKISSTFPDAKIDQIDPLQNQLCRVCEEPAAGFHFGAFTCEGCKSFFGRTCNNQSVIQECKNNYRCVVDKKNRTACKACRLRKCLLVGMSKSGSRYGRRSNWFKIHCLMQQNLGKTGAPPPPPPPPVSTPPNHPVERSLPPTISWPPPSSPLLSPLKTEIPRLHSRSPSPLNISTDAASSKSSQSPLEPVSALSPRKIHDISPRSDAPPPPPPPALPLIPTPTSLPALYGFPPPLPFLAASHPFPFYRLSPLLAGNPFLANSLLFSMAGAGAGQKSPADLIKDQQQTHADLLKEHQALLETYASAARQVADIKQERPASSPTHAAVGVGGETPIDLTVRLDKNGAEEEKKLLLE